MSRTAPGREITEERIEAARLVVYETSGCARSRWLARGALDIGRDPSNGLCLDDSRVSGGHARLRRRRDSGRFEIVDQGSSNGTFVNGERVSQCLVEEGSVIRVGDTLIVVEIGFEPVGEDDPQRSLASLRMDGDVAHAVAGQMPVLITGSTGAGKGFLAQRIAEKSERRAPFLHVNCAAIPAELIESELFGHVRGAFTGATTDKTGLIAAAHGGTLFLDEIGAAPLSFQAKLLTCIEAGEVRPVGSTRPLPVDVRFIAATNLDVDEAIDKGDIREDLYFRLAALPIRIPPLKERRVDIVPISCRAMGAESHRVFVAETLEALLLYDWPGNVRELLNVAERLRLLAGDEQIDYHQLPDEMWQFLKTRKTASSKRQLGKIPSRERLEAELAAADGNVSELARRLGKHRNQVVRWLDAHGLRK